MKCPILNSSIPLIFDKIFADLKVMPWPACTSMPRLFAYFTLFNIFANSLEYFFLLLIKLQIFPVCISIHSAPSFFALKTDSGFGSMNRLVRIFFSF